MPFQWLSQDEPGCNLLNHCGLFIMTGCWNPRPPHSCLGVCGVCVCAPLPTTLHCYHAMPSRKAASPYLQRLCIRALRDTGLVRDLSPADLAASWLHPIVLQCKSAPLLWSLAEWPHLTVRQVAGRLLVAMLKLTRNSVQTVSKDLVIQLKMWELDPTTCSRTIAEVKDLKAA